MTDRLLTEMIDAPTGRIWRLGMPEDTPPAEGCREGPAPPPGPGEGHAAVEPPVIAPIGRRILAFAIDAGLIGILVLILTTNDRNAIADRLSQLYLESVRIAENYPGVPDQTLHALLWTRLPLPPDLPHRESVLRLRQSTIAVQSAARDYWRDCATWWVVCFLYYSAVALGWRGRTIGKHLLRLAVVCTDSEAPGWGKALQRALLYLWSGLPFGFGFYWVFLDDEGRCWHDRIAGTRVIYLSGRPPAATRLKVTER